MEGHDITWWEIHRETLRLDGDPIVTKWEVFKAPSSTLLGMKRTIGFVSITSRKSKGKVYTTKFRKMVIMIAISPMNLDILLKYLGGCWDLEMIPFFIPFSHYSIHPIHVIHILLYSSLYKYHVFFRYD